MTFVGSKSSKVFARSSIITGSLGLVRIILGIVIGNLGVHGLLPVDAFAALVTVLSLSSMRNEGSILLTDL